MQDQPIEDAPRDLIDEECRTDKVVLSLMWHDRSWPWSLDEIAREIGSQPNAEDAVRRLSGAGLLHRHGEFVFPSRAARRGAEIELGSL